MKSLEELVSTEDIAKELIPKVIVERVEEAARARRWGRNLVRVNEDLVRTKARTLVVGFRSALGAVSVGEGEKLSTKSLPSTIEYTAVTLVPTKKGTFVHITQEAIDGCEFNLIRDAITEAGYALADKEDKDIIDALVSGATAAGRTIDASSSTYGTWGVEDAAYKILVAAVTEIKSKNWNPRILVVHPNGLQGILSSGMFIDASRYGSAEPIINGEIGKIAGLKVLVTTNIDEDKALVVDPDRAGVLAIKRPIEMKRWDNPDTDSVELYFYTEYDVKATDTDALMLITNIPSS